MPFFLSRVVNLHKSNYEIGFKVSSSPGIYPRCNTFHSELYLNKSDFWHWSNYMFQSPHKHHRYTNPSNTITKHIPIGWPSASLTVCTQNHKSLHVIQLSSLLYLKQTQCISKKKNVSIFPIFINFWWQLWEVQHGNLRKRLYSYRGPSFASEVLRLTPLRRNCVH